MREDFNALKGMSSPCKNCTNRKVGCHSSCDRYKDWHGEYSKRKNKIRESADLQRKLDDFAIQSVMRKRKNNKWRKLK